MAMNPFLQEIPSKRQWQMHLATGGSGFRRGLGLARFGLVWFGLDVAPHDPLGEEELPQGWANLLLSHNLWQLIGSRSEELQLLGVHCESRASQLASQQLSKPAIVWA